MSQNGMVILLRQISNSLPGAAVEIPNEISELSFAQIYLLNELFEREKSGGEPLLLSALSRETGFSKATICATLKKLRKGGYVQMQMDDADNRRKEITLTPQAWEVESTITQYISALDQALCAGLSGEELENMGRSLQVMLCNVKKSENRAHA